VQSIEERTRLLVRLAAAKERAFEVKAILLVQRTVQAFGEDNGAHLAAGIAYYAMFSIFPLLLGLISIASSVAEASEVRREIVDFMATYLPGSNTLVAETVEGVVKSRASMGLVALLGLLWSGSAIFAAIRRSINRAWGVERQRSFIRQKAVEFSMMLTAALLLIVSIASTTVYKTISAFEIPVFGLGMVGHNPLWQMIGVLLPFAFSLLVFALIYRYLPNTRVYWGDVWPGAVFASVAFELAKNGFAWYLESFATYNLVYGSLASVVVFLFWAYLCSIILLIGAELTSEYSRLYGSRSAKP
jgi:membrane protein